tara:strand:+ start:1762 stop:1935 length:174 start_codon:yes stop_codon:yes gene_type:complete
MTKPTTENPKPKSSATIKAEAREQRLKEQLRQNMHRRKAQKRARNTPTTEQEQSEQE